VIGLHTTWLVAVFQRLSVHESLLVRRWAVLTVLSMDYYNYHDFLLHNGAKVVVVVVVVVAVSNNYCTVAKN